MKKLIYKLLLLLIFNYSLGSNVIANTNSDQMLAKYFSTKALTLTNTSDLNPLVDVASKHQLVMLGESTHGTKEFYELRSAISKELIKKHNFKFIAIEASWSFVLKLNAYIKGHSTKYTSAKDILLSFNNWPEWMWKNKQIEELAEWLKTFNKNLPEEQKVGFYGLDLYEPDVSINQVLLFIDRYFPRHYQNIKQKLSCFTVDKQDAWDEQVKNRDFTCSQDLFQAVDLVSQLINSNKSIPKFERFSALQNTIVAQNSESFYRWNSYNQIRSWNVRSKHMWQGVLRLIRLHGINAKGIVWAHNTHVGDVQATPSEYAPGAVTMGYLSNRANNKTPVFVIGFGTSNGSFLAGESWGTDAQIMTMQKPDSGSYEDLLNSINKDKFYFIFDYQDRNNPLMREARSHRAIGVVYDEDDESKNYIPTLLPWRYDGFIFIKGTNPLKSLD